MSDPLRFLSRDANVGGDAAAERIDGSTSRAQLKPAGKLLDLVGWAVSRPTIKGAVQENLKEYSTKSRRGVSKNHVNIERDHAARVSFVYDDAFLPYLSQNPGRLAAVQSAVWAVLDDTHDQLISAQQFSANQPATRQDLK
jgi:hypothetical protein